MKAPGKLQIPAGAGDCFNYNRKKMHKYLLKEGEDEAGAFSCTSFVRNGEKKNQRKRKPQKIKLGNKRPARS